MWSDLTFNPSFKVKQGQPNLKMLITRLLLVLVVCNVKPTYRISWAGNLLIWSDLTLGPSSKIKRGQPNIKVLIVCLSLVLEVCNVKPTSRKSWAGNLLMWSDFYLWPLLQGQTMVHWLWWVVFPVHANLHQFFNTLGLVHILFPFVLFTSLQVPHIYVLNTN